MLAKMHKIIIYVCLLTVLAHALNWASNKGKKREKTKESNPPQDEKPQQDVEIRKIENINIGKAPAKKRTGYPYPQALHFNNSGLSIVSWLYNPGNSPSAWISHLLGEQAVYHNRSYMESSRAGLSLSTTERLQRVKIFEKYFSLPREVFSSPCSFEMLTYLLVDYDHPVSHAYSFKNKPSTGFAMLEFSRSSKKEHRGTDKIIKDNHLQWKCYYRAMYEFMPKKLKVLNTSHWPVFVFCPAPLHDTSCLSLTQLYREALLPIVEKKKGVTSTHIQQFMNSELNTRVRDSYDLYALDLRYLSGGAVSSLSELIEGAARGSQHLVSSPEELKKAILPAELTIFQSESSWSVPISFDLLNDARKSPAPHQRAVCNVIPYSTTDLAKKKLNAAMLVDFVRLYAALGFRVAVFDHFGVNERDVVDGDYSRRFNRKGAFGVKELLETDRFLYFNYTILQQLHPYLRYYKADSIEGLSRSIVRSDIDKRMTYTHCRMMMQQRYGIEDVIVVDFDEYLYCPRAGPTALEQRRYLDDYFFRIKSTGVEQLVMKQRVLVSKQDNLTDCLYKQLNDAARESARSSKDGDELVPINNHTIRAREMRAAPASLFRCLGAFDHVVKHYFEKSMHFGVACPFTSFHYASYLRFYDCVASTYVSASRSQKDYSLGGCSVVHLTTRPAQYNRTHSHNMAVVRKAANELVGITNNL